MDWFVDRFHFIPIIDGFARHRPDDQLGVFTLFSGEARVVPIIPTRGALRHTHRHRHEGPAEAYRPRGPCPGCRSLRGRDGTVTWVPNRFLSGELGLLNFVALPLFPREKLPEIVKQMKPLSVKL